MIEDVTLIDYDDSSMDKEFISAIEYEDATRTVVRTIGRDAKCDVVFMGEKAAVGKDKKKTGRVVMLPANNPEHKMTKKQYFVGQGFANHETLHNLCTDIDGLQPRMDTLVKHKQHLTVALANAIEDIRIENAGQQLYPGIPRKIDTTAEFAARKFLDMEETERDEICKDFKQVGPLAITWAGRKKLGYHAPALEKCLSLLPEDVRKRAEKYSDIVLSLPTGAVGVGNLDRDACFKGSHQGVDLAAWIAKEELQDPEDEDEDDKDSEGGGDGEGDGDEGGEGGDGASQWGGGADAESMICDQSDIKPADPDFLRPVADLLESKINRGKYRPLTTALDVYVEVGDNTSVAKRLFDKENLKAYKKTTEMMSGKLSIMKSKLERALATKMDREYTSGHRSGRIDVRSKGVHIMKGMENVFRRREGGKDLSSAVSLLIDASGSMSGSKILLAQQAAIAMVEAIGRVGVPVEVMVFNNRSPNKDEIQNYDEIYKAYRSIMDTDDRGYGRSEPLTMYVPKRFDANMVHAKQGLGGIQLMAGHNNSDGEALIRAWDSLRKRPEKNKILMVFSDGQPACFGNGTVQQHLRDTVSLLTKEGCNCIGIGIQSDAVSSYYPKYTVLNNAEDLAGSTLDNIARALLGERFIVDHGKLLKEHNVDAARVR